MSRINKRKNKVKKLLLSVIIGVFFVLLLFMERMFFML